MASKGLSMWVKGVVLIDKHSMVMTLSSVRRILNQHGFGDAAGDLERRENGQTKGMLMIKREPIKLNIPYPYLVSKT